MQLKRSSFVKNTSELAAMKHRPVQSVDGSFQTNRPANSRMVRREESKPEVVSTFNSKSKKLSYKNSPEPSVLATKTVSLFSSSPPVNNNKYEEILTLRSVEESKTRKTKDLEERVKASQTETIFPVDSGCTQYNQPICMNANMNRDETRIFANIMEHKVDSPDGNDQFESIRQVIQTGQDKACFTSAIEGPPTSMAIPDSKESTVQESEVHSTIQQILNEARDALVSDPIHETNNYLVPGELCNPDFNSIRLALFKELRPILKLYRDRIYENESKIVQRQVKFNYINSFM
ncbi:unnamed protein product [Protopolystoma xenopodis]|uniref:Uncharacterized protein n=1 Tax=Protopolystoma xenopodis TaxID=117903 RepID=A0A448X146_9PLAT|nr:unnamed protein product [Protopolystoma xenopodis]